MTGKIKTCCSIAALSLFIPLPHLAAQSSSTDAQLREQVRQTEERGNYLWCVRRNQCTEQQESCLRNCEVEAARISKKSVEEILQAMKSQNNAEFGLVSSFVKERLFGLSNERSAPAATGAVTPKIIYTSDKGKLFEKWWDAEVALLYAQSEAGAVEGAVKEGKSHREQQAAITRSCEEMAGLQAALTGIKDRSEIEGNYADCKRMESASPSSQSSSLQADLDKAQLKRKVAAQALTDIEAEMHSKFPDLEESIRQHRADLSEATVLKEGTDYYWETYCNGRCPS